MLAQSEADGLEIAKLRQANSLAAGTTLSKLQEIVVKSESGGAGNPHANQMYVKRYEQLTREELSKNLDEKDNLITRMKDAISGYEAQVKALNLKNQNLYDKIGDLENELAIEREQRELKAKVRELEKIKKDLADKSKLNEALKTAVDKLNERM